MQPAPEGTGSRPDPSRRSCLATALGFLVSEADSKGSLTQPLPACEDTHTPRGLEHSVCLVALGTNDALFWGGYLLIYLTTGTHPPLVLEARSQGADKAMLPPEVPAEAPSCLCHLLRALGILQLVATSLLSLSPSSCGFFLCLSSYKDTVTEFRDICVCVCVF